MYYKTLRNYNVGDNMQNAMMKNNGYFIKQEKQTYKHINKDKVSYSVNKRGKEDGQAI